MKNQGMLLLLLLILTMFAQTSRAEQLILPDKVVFEADITSDLGNDIYLDLPNELGLLDYSFWSETNDLDVYSTTDAGRSGVTSYVMDEKIDLVDANALYQLNNQSAEDQVLKFKSSYKDLSTAVTDGQIKDVILQEDESYLINFDVANAGPGAIKLAVEGQDSFSSLSVTILDPEGQSSTRTVVLVNNVVNHIPFLTLQSGEYLLRIVAPNENLILQEMSLILEPEINTVSGGYTDHLQGEDASIQFFKLEIDSPEIPNFVTFDGAVYESDYVDPALAGIMGTMDLRLLSSYDGNFFGISGGTETVVADGVDIYMAVVITPPNDADPYIKAKKTELELPLGYDIRYNYWFDLFDEIEELPTDMNSKFDDSMEPTLSETYWFYKIVTEDMVVGVNATGRRVDLSFHNVEDPTLDLNVNSNNHNVMNQNNDNLRILKEGTYLVEIRDNTNDASFNAYISMFEIDSIGQDGTGISNLSFNEVLFVHLPVAEFETSLVNLTYINHQNMSFDLSYSLYDSEGLNFLDNSFTFESYSNVDTFNYVEDNFTNFGGNDIVNQVNNEGWYLRLKQTSNILWNTTFADPENQVHAGDNLSGITNQIQIDRWRLMDDLKRNNPNEVYLRAELTDDYSQFLNQANSSILSTFNFPADRGGHRLILQSTNMSFSIEMFDGTGSWFSQNAVWSDVDGVDTYTLDLEFGVVEDTNFGLIFDFSIAALNGTFQVVSMERVDAQELSDFSFNIANLHENSADGTFNWSSLLLFGGIGLAAVAVIGGLVVLKRRGSFDSLGSKLPGRSDRY